MPKFSKSSIRKLSTCDKRLQDLFEMVISGIDCTIICGHRGKEEQLEAYQNGFSKLLFPYSKHNKMPSRAVDVMRYPIKWDDKEYNYYFAGYVKAIADILQIQIEWGGDWASFPDIPHWQLKD